jgi:hypothetical protein
MKTITLLYFALAVFAASCTTQNDYGEFDLKGKVKTCVQTMYEAKEKFGKWELGSVSYSGHYRVSFDENGQYTEIDELDSGGDLKSKKVAKRENGKLTEALVYDGKGRLDFTTKTTYISDDEKVLNRYYNEDYEASEIIKRFREDKMLKGLEEKQTFKDGRIVKNIYRYEKKGVTIVDTTMYRYVKVENSLTTILTDEEGVLLHERYEYLDFDEHKNWTKALVYRCQRSKFTYKDGKTIENLCEDAEEIKEPEYIAVRQIEYY